MRVFLTGVAGYLGRRVAEALAEEGHALAVMVRTNAEDSAARRLYAWPVRMQLNDTASLAATAAVADAVVHCAHSDDPHFTTVNSQAVAVMLDALRPGCAFVMPGPSLVFGSTGAGTFDGSEPHAPGPAFRSQAALHARVLAAGRARKLRTAVVVAPLVYGGGMGALLPSVLLRSATLAGYAGCPADCDPIWSTVHVADWAALVARAAERTPIGSATFVAAADPWPVRAVCNQVAHVLGIHSTLPVQPAEAAALWGPFGPALFKHHVFTSARAELLLDWAPAEACLEEELSLLADALRAGLAHGGKA